jgi:phosphopantothenoylcysteine decarboxylase/phosphopantothenate--cysteine ligase
MNTDMWEQATVQRNWHTLTALPRFQGIEPGAGILACDRVGTGRMAEPEILLRYLESSLHTQGKQDLQGQRLLMTAGATREFIDPVRFLSNPATGRMGIALAEAARHRGATVTLIHAPSPPAIPLSPGIAVITVTTAQEMHNALQQHFPDHDAVFMAAAVGDLQPEHYSPSKLPKDQLPNPLPLVPVPDLIASLSPHKQPHQRLIGFAAQTGDILPPAWEKLRRKGLDAIVANPVDQPHSGFGSDYNQAILLDAQGQELPLVHSTKLVLAHRIFDWYRDCL